MIMKCINCGVDLPIQEEKPTVIKTHEKIAICYDCYNKRNYREMMRLLNMPMDLNKAYKRSMRKKRKKKSDSLVFNKTVTF